MQARSNKAPDTPQRARALMTGVGNEGGAVSSQSRMRSVLIYFHVTVNIQFASAKKNLKICYFFHSSTAAVFGCGVFGRLVGGICTYVATCKSCFQSAAADLWADPDTDQCAESGGGRLSVPIIHF